MQEQLRVKQAECDRLDHRHACTVRYHNSTVYSIDALAAQQLKEVRPVFLAKH